jgi:hypothetical protein
VDVQMRDNVHPARDLGGQYVAVFS